MRVVARRALDLQQPPYFGLKLLLEGSWAGGDDNSETPANLRSLDDDIDGRRFGWIDDAAERIAARIVEAAADGDPNRPNFADLNVVRLRYAAVQWLRSAAWWRSLAAASRPREVELVVEANRDEEHTALWRSLAEAEGFELWVHAVSRSTSARSTVESPANALWRRSLARLFANRRRTFGAANAPRALFCGNPRLLDPVCDELLRRDVRVAWLYDRFPVGAWRQRRGSVDFLTCDVAADGARCFGDRLLRRPVCFEGIDLSPVVEAWYRRWRPCFASLQSRQASAVERHFETLRPTHVVLDEDATPLARAVVERAACMRARSLVVQHGVCGVRFGFAPLKADAICVADQGSRRQLLAWGVDDGRIAVTGSPARQTAVAKLRRRTAPTRDAALPVVLLATVPPRDDRPDAVAFHLTTRTYRRMLRGALREIAARPGLALLVKPHPRALQEPVLQALLAATPGLRYRTIDDVPTDAALVVSCGSSAGVEAAEAGLPVIQLLPEGSGPMLPHAWYGLRGTARSESEFSALLDAAIAECRRGEGCGAPAATATVEPCAERRIVDLLLAVGLARDRDSRSPAPINSYESTEAA